MNAIFVYTFVNKHFLFIFKNYCRNCIVKNSFSMLLLFVTLIIFIQNITITTSSDVTSLVFGSKPINGIPAAFGDINSDELTDLFIITNNSRQVKALLANHEGHLQESSSFTCSFRDIIASVIPGDYDGDAFMDLLVLTKTNEKKDCAVLNGYILWGNLTSLNCTVKEPLLKSCGQPIAVEVNHDFIIDLFGENVKRDRVFWMGNANRSLTEVLFNNNHNNLCHNLMPNHIRDLHSNAFLDLNGDSKADLFITSGSGKNKQFELWYANTNGYECGKIIVPPEREERIGQSLFLDLEQSGRLDQLVPIGENSVYVVVHNNWTKLSLDLQYNSQPCKWFQSDNPLSQAVTFRAGDFNMDGFPDVITTLSCSDNNARTVLFENIPCSDSVMGCDNLTRTFKVVWDAFAPFTDGTVAGAFYDLFQDGVMDVLLVQQQDSDNFQLMAFKNNLDYDANFVKIMVLSGLSNPTVPFITTPLGKRKRTFGSNLPGPMISYRTIDQEGLMRVGNSAQIPQSAHYALCLPYTTFALGRTPNFIEGLTVALDWKSREWSQLIPNSQMVVIPTLDGDIYQWRMQLFVTPSNVVAMSAIGLGVTCIVILGVILILHYMERKVDLRERQQDALRFHFDAM